MGRDSRRRTGATRVSRGRLGSHRRHRVTAGLADCGRDQAGGPSRSPHRPRAARPAGAVIRARRVWCRDGCCDPSIRESRRLPSGQGGCSAIADAAQRQIRRDVRDALQPWGCGGCCNRCCAPTGSGRRRCRSGCYSSSDGKVRRSRRCVGRSVRRHNGGDRRQRHRSATSNGCRDRRPDIPRGARRERAGSATYAPPVYTNATRAEPSPRRCQRFRSAPGWATASPAPSSQMPRPSISSAMAPSMT